MGSWDGSLNFSVRTFGGADASPTAGDFAGKETLSRRIRVISMLPKPESDADVPDTHVRIDAKPSATTPLSDTADMVAAALVADATGHHGQSPAFRGRIRREW